MTVSAGTGSSAGLGAPRRGVYMRQPHEAAGPASYTVSVTPALHEVGLARVLVKHVMCCSGDGWTCTKHAMAAGTGPFSGHMPALRECGCGVVL